MSEEVIQVIASDPVVVEITSAESTPANIAYHHSQGVSSDTWEIEHNLGFFPNITTMDSSGAVAEGEIEHLSAYRVRVTFSAPFSGNAYLS